MAARQQLTTQADAGTARPRYLAAIRGFAHGAAGGLSEATLAALYPLNAAYYLRDLLPERVHLAAVGAAADRLTAATSLDQPAGRSASLPMRTATVHTLVRLAGTRSDAPAATTLLQHALELEPLLARRELRAVRAAVHERLLAMPAAADDGIRRRAAFRGGLGGWAFCNDRPPRNGEIVAWADCLGQRPAIELAQQALAGGLRFDALLDALSLAAARRLHALPAAQTAAALIAAHAVRRLTEIARTPALVAWLGVAGRLEPLNRARIPRDKRPAPEPKELALAAARSDDPLLMQVAEAALMEAEALLAELRPFPLLAVERLLAADERGHDGRIPTQHVHAAANAAGGFRSWTSNEQSTH